MCGIAGYSLSSESRIDRTLAAQTLLAAIAERGSDAAGYAYRGPGLELEVHKQRTGASDLLDLVGLPKGAGQVLLHVRDYTKGHPSLAANNHPIRHGTVVGIHNGIVANDEEIFARRGYERAEDGMTVDSEAIFALMEDEANDAAALAELHGSMAAAWIDERVPDVLFLARGVGRPLWIGQGKHELFFASTRAALELIEQYAGLVLDRRELAEGTLLGVSAGCVARTETFRPDRSFREEPLPAVRASDERRSALARLAAIAVAAR